MHCTARALLLRALLKRKKKKKGRKVEHVRRSAPWIRKRDRANRAVRAINPFSQNFIGGRSIAYRSRGRVDDRAVGESASIPVKRSFADYVVPRGPPGTRQDSRRRPFAYTFNVCMYARLWKKLYLLLPRAWRKLRKLRIAASISGGGVRSTRDRDVVLGLDNVKARPRRDSHQEGYISRWERKTEEFSV